jgi:hypothetical protein
MSASKRARLGALPWKASRDSARSLGQPPGNSRVLEVHLNAETHLDAETPVVPEQRPEAGYEDWSGIRTDSGEQRWLNHLAEPGARVSSRCDVHPGACRRA